jgi:hypothetical protein
MILMGMYHLANVSVVIQRRARWHEWTINPSRINDLRDEEFHSRA